MSAASFTGCGVPVRSRTNSGSRSSSARPRAARSYPASENATATAGSTSACSQMVSTSSAPVGSVAALTRPTTEGPCRSTPDGGLGTAVRTPEKPSQRRNCAAQATASCAVLIVSGRNGGRSPPSAIEARARPSQGPSRTVTPQGHSNSACGHCPSRPQTSQTTSVQASAHERWRTDTGELSRGRETLTGAPQAHGYCGGR